MGAEYKDHISNAYHGEMSKVRHIQRAGVDSRIFRASARRFVGNAKRRQVVVSRLKKLNKYLRRAWNGYSFGVIKSKGSA